MKCDMNGCIHITFISHMFHIMLATSYSRFITGKYKVAEEEIWGTNKKYVVHLNVNLVTLIF